MQILDTLFSIENKELSANRLWDSIRGVSVFFRESNYFGEVRLRLTEARVAMHGWDLWDIWD